MLTERVLESSIRELERSLKVERPLNELVLLLGHSVAAKANAGGRRGDAVRLWKMASCFASRISPIVCAVSTASSFLRSPRARTLSDLKAREDNSVECRFRMLRYAANCVVLRPRRDVNVGMTCCVEKVPDVSGQRDAGVV